MSRMNHSFLFHVLYLKVIFITFNDSHVNLQASNLTNKKSGTTQSKALLMSISNASHNPSPWASHFHFSIIAMKGHFLLKPFVKPHWIFHDFDHTFGHIRIAKRLLIELVECLLVYYLFYHKDYLFADGSFLLIVCFRQ